MLVAAALAVLCLGVYLFIQVRATPAQADASTHVPVHDKVTGLPPKESVVAEAAPKVAKPETPQIGSTRTSWERPAGENAPSGEPTDGRKVDLKGDNLMELASKAYDAQDFDQAVAIAGKILSKDPNNVRMLRIMVSSNCIQGDSVVAQQHYERLPKFDREQMKERCDRYGVVFKDPP